MPAYQRITLMKSGKNHITTLLLDSSVGYDLSCLIGFVRLVDCDLFLPLVELIKDSQRMF